MITHPISTVIFAGSLASLCCCALHPAAVGGHILTLSPVSGAVREYYPLTRADRGVTADLSFETSDFMRHTAYRNVRKLDNDDAPSGAYGSVNRDWEVTHSGKWYIEEQRNGGDLIIGGISAHNRKAIDRGLKILEWGFRQQKPDGMFPSTDPFHSSSFFVEAAAHACLLLQVSRYGTSYASQIADMTERLRRAAHWMMLPSIEEAGKRENRIFTHRRYLVACALGETGVLAHDDVLIHKSEEYVRDGMSLQDPSGFNPERGGYDSSYNAGGLVFAERYYVLVAPNDIRPALGTMLKNGVAWQASKVAPDGSQITAGNTRVQGIVTETDRAGQAKHIAIGQVFRCFAYWAQISGDAHFGQLAETVADYFHYLRHPGEQLG